MFIVGSRCAIGLSALGNVVHGQTLVAQYQFANASNLGLDSSPFANNATNTNVTQGLDRFGVLSAGNFNGANSVLTKPGSLTGFDGLPGFTYSAWINRSPVQAGTYGGIVSQDPSANISVVNRLLLSPSDNPYFDAGAHADATAATALTDGIWSHLIMSADDTGPGSTVRIYLNGAPDWYTVLWSRSCQQCRF